MFPNDKIKEIEASMLSLCNISKGSPTYVMARQMQGYGWVQAIIWGCLCMNGYKHGKLYTPRTTLPTEIKKEQNNGGLHSMCKAEKDFEIISNTEWQCMVRKGIKQNIAG